MSERWWFRFVVRAVLGVLALWLLVVANDRYEVFRIDFNANFRMDAGKWLAWVAAAIGAGFVFGLATWLPFTRVRYSWSRLLLAALALTPLAQFWWLYIREHRVEGGWLYRADWFLNLPGQSALAVLAGVAIASGFRAARGTHESP
jgi:hypothetical protein